ncbi:hypothetical protein ACTD5D_30935 [Nocardia takedensis]|uniref:hypothetical protein n=1 Tax=Nocardia takedensis TaxID=259390 RepID=UPI003F768D6E
MDLYEMFIETVEDLRRRCDLRATEYDMVQASGLIRRLLIDGTALWYQVNREFKMRPIVEWMSVRSLVRAKTAENVRVAGLALDPVMAKAFLAVNFREREHTDVFGEATKSGDFETFLSAKVMDRPLPGESPQVATVRDLVKHYANREGGVHYDSSGKRANEFLEQVRGFADEDLRMMIIACGRIIVRALEPMVGVVILKDKPWPAGLDFTYSPPRQRNSMEGYPDALPQ